MDIAAIETSGLPERTWSDVDGDTLAVNSFQDGRGPHVLQLQVEGPSPSGVVRMDRGQALELVEHVRRYLDATEPATEREHVTDGTDCWCGPTVAKVVEPEPTCCSGEDGPCCPEPTDAVPLPDAEADGYSWLPPASEGLGPWMGRGGYDFPAGTVYTGAAPFAPLTGLAEQSTIAAEAQDAQYGGREDDYGHPRQNFTRTATMWTALLSDKLAEGDYVSPEDVARCLAAAALSDDVQTPERSNRVRAVSHLIALDRLETGK